ncbi:DUF559 domain-containing protein [Mariniluteicoccus flavus]
MTDPFLRRTAIESGITQDQLRSSPFRRLLHGVYIASSEPESLETWVRGARLVLPEDARVTGMTALRLAGARFGRDFPLHFVTCARPPIRRDGLLVQRVRTLSSPGGIAGIAEAYAVACDRLSLLEAVQLGEHLVQLKLTTFEQIHTVATKAVREHLRRGPESVRETRLRLTLTLAGLPEPDIQVEVFDEKGRLVARLDHAYADLKLAVEYDGRHHAEDSEQWNRDIRRREDLERLGWRIIVVTSERLARPITLVREVHQALKDLGRRCEDPCFDLRWRAEFGVPAS